MSRKGRCVLGEQARRPVGDDSAAIVPRNLGIFAHDAVRGIERAQKKRPRQISCANQLGNEANRRGQWGVRKNHIFAPDQGGVKARSEKAPREARPGIPRENSMYPLGMGHPAGY